MGHMRIWTCLAAAGGDERGFTLIEMLVVVALIVILTIAGVRAMGSAPSRLRGQLYGMLADLNLARSEAVNRNREVLCDFLMAGEVDGDGVAASADGYRICLDNDADGDCDSGDEVLRERFLPAGLAFYDLDLPAPEGPDREPDGSGWSAGGDGVSFTANRMAMRPDGGSNKAGTVYLCAVEGGELLAGPVALVVSRVGRIRVDVWQPHRGRWKGR